MKIPHNWQTMSLDERVAHLHPLITLEVRFVLQKIVIERQKVFGSDPPIEWNYGILQGLRIVSYTKPGIYIKYHSVMGGIECVFDDLHYIEADPACNEDPTTQELERLRLLRTNLSHFIETRREYPQYLDICQLLTQLLNES